MITYSHPTKIQSHFAVHINQMLTKPQSEKSTVLNAYQINFTPQVYIYIQYTKPPGIMSHHVRELPPPLMILATERTALSCLRGAISLAPERPRRGV
jgi:hypothetical protein